MKLAYINKIKLRDTFGGDVESVNPTLLLGTSISTNILLSQLKNLYIWTRR